MAFLTYDVAQQKAIQALAGTDLTSVCATTGARIISGTGEARVVALPYFGSEIRVALPDGEFHPDGLRQEEQILALHYLLSADPNWDGSTKTEANRPPGSTPTPQSPGDQELVSYRSLPGGMFYNATFVKRGPARVCRAYGKRPEDFLQAGRETGAQATDLGDAALLYDAFPKVRVCVVLHLGDDELPAEVNFLFNMRIVDHLSLEDIAVLGGVVATRLTVRPGKRRT
jgi:hypothetical protein